jgi:4-hydroxyphenylpyruvate dioxygenase
MRSQGQQFLPIPDQYYKTVNDRVPGHKEDLERLKQNKILIDGNELGYLLQIFTIKEPELDPFFFEFITRRSFLGFGEGNVKTLFESVEAEQFRSGYLKVGTSV